MTEKLLQRDEALLLRSAENDAKRLLFRPGVQLRMAVAVILCIFAAFVPVLLMNAVYYWSGYETFFETSADAETIDPMAVLSSILVSLSSFGMILAEIFLVLPLLSGLSVMAADAAAGETPAIDRLFACFTKKRYLRSLATGGYLALFTAIAAGGVYAVIEGTMALYFLAQENPVAAPYAGGVLVLGGFSALFAILVMTIFSTVFYLLLPIRAVYPEISCIRALGLSARLLFRNLRPYFRMRLRFLLLDLISVLSVCALFPIYTLPLSLITGALYVQILLPDGEENEY